MKLSFRLRRWFVFKARCQLPWRSCGLRATCNFLKDYEIATCLVSWSKWSNKQHSLLFKASPLTISETSPLAAACVGFYVLFQYRDCHALQTLLTHETIKLHNAPGGNWVTEKQAPVGLGGEAGIKPRFLCRGHAWQLQDYPVPLL